MMFWMIGAGLGVLALLFRLAAQTRLTIPLLYTVSMRRRRIFQISRPQGKRERRGHHQHRGPVALNQPSPISSRMIRSLILIAPTSTSILKISSPT